MKTTNKILITTLLIGICLFSLASALSVDSVLSSPNQISPGGKVNLDLTIKNDNGERVNNIAVSLELNGASIAVGTGLQQVFAPVPFSPYQSSGTQTVDKISKDNSGDFNFALIADADAATGVYKIPVDITYTTESGTVGKDSGIISLIVDAPPLLGISSDSSGVIKGQKNSLTIKVTNSGLGNAKFLSISVAGINNAQILGASSFYIGDINKDDFDTAQLNLFLNTNSGSTISVPVTIGYKDEMNKEYTDSKTISIKAYTQQEAIAVGLASQSYTGTIVAIIIFAIIIYIIYRIIRGILRRRKNRIKET
jgi:hypothetical protein